MDPEEAVWQNTDWRDLWVLDKLILSRALGYTCGPVGQDVPQPDWYIVRPAVNALGCGLGACDYYLTKSTDHLPVGHFWSQIFRGDHISVDYAFGRPTLSVKGIRNPTDYSMFAEWYKTDVTPDAPVMLREVLARHPRANIEYIGGQAIEMHLRWNTDFEGGVTHYIPVRRDTVNTKLEGYVYRHKPEPDGRLGAFVKYSTP